MTQAVRAVQRRMNRNTFTEYDEAAVERLLAGDHKVFTYTSDRLEATRRLHEAGLTGTEIARRIGVSDRTVYRQLRRLGR